jgi:NAD(P)H dehydrogenase (quinone)
VVSSSCSLLFTAAYAAFRQNFHLSRLFRFPEPALFQRLRPHGQTGGGRARRRRLGRNAKVKIYRISETGDLPEGAFEEIGAAHAIIYGSPTYMGGPARQFKKFADASSRPWFSQAWRNKLAAGFTNSASVNGAKFSTIEYFWTLSQQHGQIWIGTGLLPSNTKAHGPADVNWTAGLGGALAVSPSDASPEEAPRAGDLETAKLLGRRVAEFAERLA